MCARALNVRREYSNLKMLDYIPLHYIHINPTRKGLFSLHRATVLRILCSAFHCTMDSVMGKRLEVLWHLGSGSKKQKVWWGAFVASGIEVSSASAPRGAKIMYDTMHGHESTESTVRFISSSILEELEGMGRYVRHQWRWEGIATPERGRDDACLSIIAPASGHAEQGPALYERVATLERELADVKQRIDEKSGGVEGGAYSRVLAFARHKLGLELSRPLLGSSPSMSKYRDAHALVQEVATVDVDCCLAEFEAIWATVASMTAEGVDVVPREPDAGSSRIDRVYSIRFQQFSNLCKALAVTCEKDVKDSLVKVKVGKREKTPICVRVLGGILHGDKEVGGPMVLVIGGSASRGLDSGVPVKVLYRNSSAWDDVEGSFVDPLSVRTMSLSAIPCLEVGEESDSVAEDEMQADDSASVFSLTWRRTSDGSMALFDAPDRRAVIGCLTVSIPYVTIRGLSFCTEVLRVWSSSFNE
jgi:hypothetical protein